MTRQLHDGYIQADRQTDRQADRQASMYPSTNLPAPHSPQVPPAWPAPRWICAGTQTGHTRGDCLRRGCRRRSIATPPGSRSLPTRPGDGFGSKRVMYLSATGYGHSESLLTDSEENIDGFGGKVHGFGENLDGFGGTVAGFRG